MAIGPDRPATTWAGAQVHPSADGAHGSKNTRLMMRALRRAPLVLPIVGLAFLAFVSGAVLTVAETFPSDYVRYGYQGAVALYDKLTRYRDVYATDLWRPSRSDARGVTIYDPQRARQGFTLYTSGHAAGAFLVDMDGRLVHEWRRPYSSVWDETSAVDDPQPDSHVYFRKAKLLPNGDLLAIYIGVGDSPYGYGMVKLDRKSNVIWKYLEHTHHDFDVAADGRIYALTHDFGSGTIPKFDHLNPPRIDDSLVILSPDGEELKKVSLLDAVVRSDYARLLYTVAFYSTRDPLHTNSVDVVDRTAAARLPFASEGQVLLSFRELNAIAVLDVDAERIVWATRGVWLGQHDPDVLANGNILLFDNTGYFGAGGKSRVIEFDPETMEIVWDYTGNRDQPLDSTIRSAQERLTNGNTLITESDGGRIFEVTPEGDIAWEYINPVRGGDGDQYVPVVSWAQHIDPGSFAAASGKSSTSIAHF